MTLKSTYFPKESVGVTVNYRRDTYMNITGNTILITGGGSGIGRALAEALHKQGNQVVIAGRRQSVLDETTAANPGIKSLALNIEDAAAIKDFADQVKQQFPALNVLINNAGIMKMEDLTSDSVDLAVAESIITTNILGPIRLTTALLPLLKSQPKSTVINVTSGLAFLPLAATPTYCATKAAMHSWSQSLRYQLRETSVEILELAPPYVQTELMGSQQAADPRAMPLAEYNAEVMSIISGPVPESGEILVERVKPLRFAEVNGNFAQVFAAVNSIH
jgi:uncharacterized oxidoreductase